MKPQPPYGLRRRYEPLPEVVVRKVYDSITLGELIKKFYKHNNRLVKFEPIGWRRFKYSTVIVPIWCFVYYKDFYVTIQRTNYSLQICNLWYRSEQAKQGYCLATFELPCVFYDRLKIIKAIATLIESKSIQPLNCQTNQQIPL